MTQEGFDVNLHKRILITLLLDIYKEIGGKIGFKGGTAVMIFYNLPRLSLDLDFDILSVINEQDKRNIVSVLNKRGNVIEEEEKRNTLFFLFNYEKGKPNIKIEFNKRIWENNNYINKQLMGVNIKIQDETTLLSNKMVALIDRKNPAARDLFDIHYFLKMNFQPNKALIKERTSMEFLDFIKEAIKHIDKNFNEKNVLQGLGELIDESQKRWVKNNLILETKKALNNLPS